MLSGMTSMAGGAAGGGGALLTLDTPPADQALASGSTSSSGITFAAPTGGSGSYSYAAALDIVSATGTPALSGSGLGPYTVTGLSDGDLCVVRMTYTDSGTGQTAEQGVAVGVAQAAGGGAGLSAILDIDWPALFGAFGAYNFLTTGGSGGTGGDGNHTYGGYTFVLDGTTAGLTQLEVTVNGLEATQSSGAFVLGVDLRALTPALNPSGLCRCISIWASTTASGTDGVQCGLRRNAAIGTWEIGDTVARYRKADATPDLWTVTYNGSSYDVWTSAAVTANADVRLQVDLDNQKGSIGRGDTGVATDPGDSDTLQEFSRNAYANAYGSFAGTYPGDTSYWALVGIGGNASGICTRFIAYGLEA